MCDVVYQNYSVIIFFVILSFLMSIDFQYDAVTKLR